jgi:hypothetical protein
MFSNVFENISLGYFDRPEKRIITYATEIGKTFSKRMDYMYSVIFTLDILLAYYLYFLKTDE